MNTKKFIWDKVINSFTSPRVLDVAYGTSNGLFWWEKGLDEGGLLVVDPLQRNLDPLKAGGIPTMKADLETSDLYGRLNQKKFEVIVCDKTLSSLSEKGGSKLLSTCNKLVADEGYLCLVAQCRFLPGRRGWRVPRYEFAKHGDALLSLYKDFDLTYKRVFKRNAQTNTCEVFFVWQKRKAQD